MDAKSYDRTKYVTVREALAMTGYGNSYLRMHLLKEGKIESIRECIPGTSIERILIVRASLEAWMKSHGTLREDGRVKTTLYLSPEEAAKVRKVLGK